MISANQVILEICADSPETARKAMEAGAGRIELCRALGEGGLTPGAGCLLRTLDLVKIPVRVLVRPRSGDFVYSESELDEMRADIEFARKSGAEGVVLGILDAEGGVDVARCRELVKQARPMKVTFHRAFDVCAQPIQALEDIIGCGFDTLLTSGCEPSAFDGATLIRQLIVQAGDRLEIMAGAGLRANHFPEIIHRTGCAAYHATFSTWVNSPMRFRRSGLSMDFPGREFQIRDLDTVAVRETVRCLQSTLDARPL